MNDENLEKTIQSGPWPAGTIPGVLIPFDCVWIKSSGKEVVLKKEGDFAASESILRYFEKGMNVKTHSNLNIDWVMTGIQKFNDLKELENEQAPSPFKIQKWREDFVNWLYPLFENSNENISYLDICFLCEQCFGYPDETLKNSFIQFPFEVQEKNYIAASIGTLLAITLGYTDSRFLSELFWIYLMFDNPLSSEVWSRSEQDFFFKHWKGEIDSSSLSNNRELLDRYFDYVSEYSKESPSFLTFKGLKKYWGWSFERLDGNGWRTQMCQEEMSDLDTLGVLVYHASRDELKIKSVLDNPILDLILIDGQESIVGRRLKRILNSSFSEARSKDDGFLEIVGL